VKFNLIPVGVPLVERSEKKHFNKQWADIIGDECQSRFCDPVSAPYDALQSSCNYRI
jgi:hypothetical protein